MTCLKKDKSEQKQLKVDNSEKEHPKKETSEKETSGKGQLCTGKI